MEILLDFLLGGGCTMEGFVFVCLFFVYVSPKLNGSRGEYQEVECEDDVLQHSEQTKNAHKKNVP